jgi:hypothetical protein
LDEYIADTMNILKESPDITEVLEERVKPLRLAEPNRVRTISITSRERSAAKLCINLAAAVVCGACLPMIAAFRHEAKMKVERGSAALDRFRNIILQTVFKEQK